MQLLQALILVTVANGAPVIARRLLGARWAWPLDGNLKYFDGRPLFGRSKTVRGIVASVLATTACAPLFGLAASVGLTVALAAMAGDLASSFTKRRLGIAPSKRATGLDQVPESLLPLIACSRVLALSDIEVVAGTLIFFAGELVLSRLLFRLHLRDRPY